MPGNQKQRKRKHRGTQTGSITRAQRSRPRNRQEAMAQARSRKSGSKSGSKRAPVDRRDVPPTWRGATIRGVLFAALLIPFSVLLLNSPLGGAIAFSVVAATLYIPMGFYIEQFLYRRRQAAKAKGRAEASSKNGTRKGG